MLSREITSSQSDEKNLNPVSEAMGSQPRKLKRGDSELFSTNVSEASSEKAAFYSTEILFGHFALKVRIVLQKNGTKS